MAEPFLAAAGRYDDLMPYRRAGRSGLQLPVVALGHWQNFGGGKDFDTQKAVVRRALDLGVTHFDLANNYGPPAGSAETNFGRLVTEDLKPYRDEIVVATKAGYYMHPGPYGEWGSRKYMLSSLDRSLQRLGLDYVDIYYHHRFDPNTPLEETMGALAQAVRSGKALYVGVSNYTGPQLARAQELLTSEGVRLLVQQEKYSMYERKIERPTPDGDSVLDVAGRAGTGITVFSPLDQGRLTDRYLSGSVPADSRAARNVFLHENDITEAYLAKTRALNAIAEGRGQTLAQLAVAWVLRDERVTSALVGASSVAQLEQTVAAVQHLAIDDDQLAAIDSALAG